MKFGGWQRFSLIDFPEKVSAILFTEGCSFRCPFCHNPQLVVPKQPSAALSEKEIFEFLTSRQGKLDGIVISGGEPTIHHDLPKFLQKIRAMGFEIKIDTNGSHPEMMQQLIHQNLVDYWAMDIKSPLVTYQTITQSTISSTTIAQSIQLIMQGTIDYEFRSTLLPAYHTDEDIEQMAKEIQGAKKYILQRFRPDVTLDPALQEYPPFSEEEMNRLCEHAKKYVPNCFWR